MVQISGSRPATWAAARTGAGRGAAVQPTWSLMQMQDMQDEWLISVWQNRPHVCRCGKRADALPAARQWCCLLPGLDCWVPSGKTRPSRHLEAFTAARVRRGVWGPTQVNRNDVNTGST